MRYLIQRSPGITVVLACLFWPGPAAAQITEGVLLMSKVG